MIFRQLSLEIQFDLITNTKKKKFKSIVFILYIVLSKPLNILLEHNAHLALTVFHYWFCYLWSSACSLQTWLISVSAPPHLLHESTICLLHLHVKMWAYVFLSSSRVCQTFFCVPYLSLMSQPAYLTPVAIAQGASILSIGSSTGL